MSETQSPNKTNESEKFKDEENEKEDKSNGKFKILIQRKSCNIFQSGRRRTNFEKE
jgi:hypothetical protein